MNIDSTLAAAYACYSPIVSSKAKNLYSFSKATRFVSPTP